MTDQIGSRSRRSAAPTIPFRAFTPHLSEQEAFQQASVLKALADPTRLRILHLLLQHEDAICVYEIVACFSLAQPTISHHLRILRDAGVIISRKRGNHVYSLVCRDVIDRASAIFQYGT